MFHPVQELQFNARARGPIQGSGGANREQLLASLCQCRPTRLRSPNVPGNAFAGHIAHTLCYGERAGSRRGQFAFVATRHAHCRGARRDTATARRMSVPHALTTLLRTRHGSVILSAVRRQKGAAASAAGNWMVGPPSSWSLQDQEDTSCAVRPAGSPHVSPMSGAVHRFRFHTSTAPRGGSHRVASAYASSVPGVSPPRLSRNDTFASSNDPLRWRRDAGQGRAWLLTAWVLGFLWADNVGDLVHILLLSGLMLLLLAFSSARDAAVRRAAGGPPNRP
jgi:hypothetical protein